MSIEIHVLHNIFHNDGDEFHNMLEAKIHLSQNNSNEHSRVCLQPRTQRYGPLIITCMKSLIPHTEPPPPSSLFSVTQ